MSSAVGQAAVGIAIGLPSAALGYLAYRRSRKVDALSAQSGVAVENREGLALIIAGLNSHIDNLQDDNKSFRDDIRFLTSRLDAIQDERDLLKLELARMRRKYGNGDE